MTQNHLQKRNLENDPRPVRAHHQKVKALPVRVAQVVRPLQTRPIPKAIQVPVPATPIKTSVILVISIKISFSILAETQ